MGQLRIREVCDHLDRASLSALFNTAEGNGKRPATECAACLDALVAKGASTKNHIQEGKDLLIRIVSMLTKLLHLYEAQGRVREEAEEYQGEHKGTAKEIS